MKDSVGVAEVILCGPPALKEIDGTGKSKADVDAELQRTTLGLKPGDIIAYIPFTDAILPGDNFEKRNIVPYANVMAISSTGVEKA